MLSVSQLQNRVSKGISQYGDLENEIIYIFELISETNPEGRTVIPTAQYASQTVKTRIFLSVDE